MKNSLVLSAGLLANTVLTLAQAGPMSLLKPDQTGGKPLMAALHDRRSTREFGAEKLSPQQLSNLLWAAFGINRPESGGRTAPSARNRQKIDIYVALRDGLYLFDAKAQALQPVKAQDLRALTGRQPFVAEVPVDLVYVADFDRMGKGPDAEKEVSAAVATGASAQNVYLYCASVGLATVLRGAIDKPSLAKAMGLRPEQRIMLAQSVGWPVAARDHRNP